MRYLLAFDVGTTRTKAVLMTTAGEVVARVTATYPIYYPHPRWAEQEPEDWWEAVGRTSRQVVAEAGIDPARILGLAFSTQMLCILCLDGQGRPLQRAISWLDGRAGEEANRLMRRLGGPRLFATLLGATLTAKDVLPKYLWLKQHAPDLYARTATFTDANGYLLQRATGRQVMEWTHASVTGLFHLKNKTWDRTAMRLMSADPGKMPELARSSEKVGGLTGEAADHLGVPEGTPVFGGAGDAMSAAVGAGAGAEGDGHLCLGTSAFVGIMTRRRLTGRRGLATVQSADRDKLLLIGEMETAGECLKWAARELYGAANHETEIYPRMDAEVATTPPGAGGLLFTPWMYGERAPAPDEHLRAGFLNLGANHNRAHLTRAIYEGVAFNLRWILDSIDDLYGLRPDPLRVIGGGARGKIWLQIVADVTGRRFECVTHAEEAGAIGAAMLSAVGLGLLPSVEAVKSILPVTETVSPDPERQIPYHRLYNNFRAAHRSLRGWYRKVNI